jgi:RNA polymerase subunit RPABC4/transcription elongation factor Spt4
LIFYDNFIYFTAHYNLPNQSRPPPMPRSFVRLSSPRSPLSAHLLQLDTSGIRYPSNQPPSYNEVMQGNEEILSLQNSSLITTYSSSSLPDLNDSQMEEWVCNKCTFLNNELMLICEICGMSRVQGTSDNQNGNIIITSRSFNPSHYNRLNASSVPTNEIIMQNII